MTIWTTPAESLPPPAFEPLYLVTLDWGFKRARQLAVARYYVASGGQRAIWRHPYWPHRAIGAEVVAWQPAPAICEADVLMEVPR